MSRRACGRAGRVAPPALYSMSTAVMELAGKLITASIHGDEKRTRVDCTRVDGEPVCSVDLDVAATLKDLDGSVAKKLGVYGQKFKMHAYDAISGKLDSERDLPLRNLP